MTSNIANKLVGRIGGFAIIATALLFFTHTANAATSYSFEVSSEPTWSETATTDTSVQYVTARAYVAGSKSLNYTTVPVYSRTTTSGTNSLGDVVGFVSNIYGPSPAFVDPYDGLKYNLTHPVTGNLVSAVLNEVNDQRLAIGSFQLSRTPFVYDLMYKKYTYPEIVGGWITFSDLNNHGQITGMISNDGGSTRSGFVYDCAAGQVEVALPGASWTVPAAIDDQGNVYGTFNASGVAEHYFIARPDTLTTDLGCSLVPRDDTFTPLEFLSGTSFEMSGDKAYGITVADFDKKGVNDIMVYHGEYTTIVYLGESNFKNKLKFKGYTPESLIAAKFSDVVIPNNDDVNNDGIADSITYQSPTIELSLGKTDGSFYYVPQRITGQKLADLNGDGYLDVINATGKVISVRFQTAPVEPVVTEPTPTDPVVTDPIVTEPVVTEPTPTDPVVTDPIVTEPAPEPTDNPYEAAIQAEFPGATVVKMTINDDGSAEFKISYEGETLEGFISPDFTIELAN